MIYSFKISIAGSQLWNVMKLLSQYIYENYVLFCLRQIMLTLEQHAGSTTGSVALA